MSENPMQALNDSLRERESVYAQPAHHREVEVMAQAREAGVRKLTKAQRDLLEKPLYRAILKDFDRPEVPGWGLMWTYSPSQTRADKLAAVGLLEFTPTDAPGLHCYRITGAGRQALKEQTA